LNILGLVYYSQKQYDRAKELMKQSMNLSKYDLIVQRNAVLVFMNIKAYSLALKAVNNYLELDPANQEYKKLKKKFKELVQ
jgi:tetratricopeptide (TPR) repeat protein